MRDKLNCPNCGAPLNGEKCPYCGTTFYDFSSIEDGKPCYMRIRMGSMKCNGNPVNTLITMRAVPRIESMTFSSDTVNICRGENRIGSYVASKNLGMQVLFNAVTSKDDSLMQVELET